MYRRNPFESNWWLLIYKSMPCGDSGWDNFNPYSLLIIGRSDSYMSEHTNHSWESLYRMNQMKLCSRFNYRMRLGLSCNLVINRNSEVWKVDLKRTRLFVYTFMLIWGCNNNTLILETKFWSLVERSICQTRLFVSRGGLKSRMWLSSNNRFLFLL